MFCLVNSYLWLTLFCCPCRVQDKYKVANLFVLPSFIPEVTVGGIMYDKLYYQYRSVRGLCTDACDLFVFWDYDFSIYLFFIYFFQLKGKKYATGYNEDVGDKYIWLKWKKKWFKVFVLRICSQLLYTTAWQNSEYRHGGVDVVIVLPYEQPMSWWNLQYL